MWNEALLSVIVWQVALCAFLRERDNNPQPLSNIQFLIPIRLLETNEADNQTDRLSDGPFSNIPDNVFTIDKEEDTTSRTKLDSEFQSRSIYLDGLDNDSEQGQEEEVLSKELRRACTRLAQSPVGLKNPLLLILCTELLNTDGFTPEHHIHGPQCECYRQNGVPMWIGRRDYMGFGANSAAVLRHWNRRKKPKIPNVYDK